MKTGGGLCIDKVQNAVAKRRIQGWDRQRDFCRKVCRAAGFGITCAIRERHAQGMAAIAQHAEHVRRQLHRPITVRVYSPYIFGTIQGDVHRLSRAQQA